MKDKEKGFFIFELIFELFFGMCFFLMSLSRED